MICKIWLGGGIKWHVYDAAPMAMHLKMLLDKKTIYLFNLFWIFFFWIATWLFVKHLEIDFSLNSIDNFSFWVIFYTFDIFCNHSKQDRLEPILWTAVAVTVQLFHRQLLPWPYISSGSFFPTLLAKRGIFTHSPWLW